MHHEPSDRAATLRFACFPRQHELPAIQQSREFHNGQHEGHAVLRCDDNGNPRSGHHASLWHGFAGVVDFDAGWEVQREEVLDCEHLDDRGTHPIRKGVRRWVHRDWSGGRSVDCTFESQDEYALRERNEGNGGVLSEWIDGTLSKSQLHQLLPSSRRDGTALGFRLCLRFKERGCFDLLLRRDLRLPSRRSPLALDRLSAITRSHAKLLRHLHCEYNDRKRNYHSGWKYDQRRRWFRHFGSNDRR